MGARSHTLLAPSLFSSFLGQTEHDTLTEAGREPRHATFLHLGNDKVTAQAEIRRTLVGLVYLVPKLGTPTPKAWYSRSQSGGVMIARQQQPLRLLRDIQHIAIASIAVIRKRWNPWTSQTPLAQMFTPTASGEAKSIKGESSRGGETHAWRCVSMRSLYGFPLSRAVAVPPRRRRLSCG